MDEKTCPKCKETKPVEEFHRNRATRDGRQAYCTPCRAAPELRKCRNESARERYAADPEYRNRRNKTTAAQRAANPEKIAAYQAAYRAANREKLVAAAAAYHAANRTKIAARQAARPYDLNRRMRDILRKAAAAVERAIQKAEEAA